MLSSFKDNRVLAYSTHTLFAEVRQLRQLVWKCVMQKGVLSFYGSNAWSLEPSFFVPGVLSSF